MIRGAILLSMALTATVAAASPVVMRVPVATELPIAHKLFYTGSDSLYVGERLLIRGEDYRFDATRQVFEIDSSCAATGDTVLLSYHPAPEWLSTPYGRAVPGTAERATFTPVPTDARTVMTERPAGSKVAIHGAKSFRVGAHSTGSREFGQTLDLNIMGEIAPNISVEGALSDRGYDVVHGVSNSQLSELDKLSLTLRSPHLTARVGDISLLGPDSPSGQRSVTGVNLSANYPGWHANATAARPKGSFATVKIAGTDNFQGPYRITQGVAASAIVAGSETVWLNGQKLSRGSGNDYEVDYFLGTITFTAKRPIDGRHRIEVDYEPLTGTYRKELFGSGVGIHGTDSNWFFSFAAAREGDDKSKLLTGSFGEEEMKMLSDSPDSILSVSGVRVDSAGNYSLVSDSLPDSVFVFVGTSLGQYRVTFSYVGPGKGEYQYRGDELYEYVGTGKGDYIPKVLLDAGSRTEHVRASGGLTVPGFADLRGEVRFSRRDMNLWSEARSSVAEGSSHNVQLHRSFGSSHSITLNRRFQAKTFAQSERLRVVDFERTYLLPQQGMRLADELLHSAHVSVSPFRALQLSATGSEMTFERLFRARLFAAEARLSSGSRLETSVKAFRTVAGYLHSDSGDGRANGIRAAASIRPAARAELKVSFDAEEQRQTYGGQPVGSDVKSAQTEMRLKDHIFTFGYVLEDSLKDSLWNRAAVRQKAGYTLVRSIGGLNFNVTGHWLSTKRMNVTDDGLLARAAVRYTHDASRLQVNTSYLMSEERRQARKLAYRQVEAGKGNYVYENGEYRPDPFGNYVQVEEFLSELAKVRRGERTFYFSKDFAHTSIRFNSAIREELLPEGRRSAGWLVPFVSSKDNAFFNYDSRLNAELQIGRRDGFYIVTVRANDDYESHRVSGFVQVLARQDAQLTFRQRARNTFFEQTGEMFRKLSTSQYSQSGEVRGYRLNAAVRQIVGLGEVAVGIKYRRADNDVRQASKVFSLSGNGRLRVFPGIELKSEIELYRQLLEESYYSVSYELTDNKFGGKGAVWHTQLWAKLKDGMRLNLAIHGRNSDSHSGRVTARGEVVAEF